MAIRIDRAKRVPLYHQIADELREQISSGQLQPGERLRSEIDLARQLGVSRITVKQALERLAFEGLLTRVQGRGTFVAKPRIPRRLTQLLSFEEEARQKGLVLQTRLLGAEELEASPSVARVLGLDPGDDIVQIRRLRILEGEPVAVQTSILPAASCREALISPEVATGSLYRFLEGLGLRPATGVEFYSAVAAEVGEAGILGIKVGTPVFKARRHAYLADGRPVELAESFLRADRYTLEVELCK